MYQCLKGFLIWNVSDYIKAATTVSVPDINTASVTVFHEKDFNFTCNL